MPADLAQYVDDNIDNFSGFVRTQVEEHRAAHELTPEERIQQQIEELEDEKEAVEEKREKLEEEKQKLEEKLNHRQEKEVSAREAVKGLFADVVQRPPHNQVQSVKSMKDTVIPNDDLVEIWNDCTMHANGDGTAANGDMVEEDYEAFADDVDDLFSGLTPREEDEVDAALDEYFGA